MFPLDFIDWIFQFFSVSERVNKKNIQNGLQIELLNEYGFKEAQEALSNTRKLLNGLQIDLQKEETCQAPNKLFKL